MKLFCQQQGKQNGPALVITHGVFGSHENLGAVIRLLVDDFRIYGVDLRNHGRSPHADTMSYTEMAADIVELMDDEGINSAAVLGHSLGGKVMMELACRYPQRVTHLVVGDIAPVQYPPHHDPVLAGLQAIDLDRITSRSEADQQLQTYISDSSTRQFLLKNLQRNDKGQFYWRLNLPAIAEQYPLLRDSIVAGKGFTGPTLFIRGETSKFIQQRNHDAILQQFPNAKIETIANAGHWLHAEQPQQFAKLVKQFILGE